LYQSQEKARRFEALRRRYQDDRFSALCLFMLWQSERTALLS